ncbi:MAG: hypothetical protein AAGC60_27450 [Acidobacteriota bacterium]
MHKQLLRSLTLLSALLTFIFTLFVILSWFAERPPFSATSIVQSVLGALAGAMITLYTIYFLRTLNANPAPLQVALVGGPRAGKTIFLTVLFDKLQVARTQRVQFQPHGRETIEMVTENLNQLNAGNWLKATSVDSIFFFRADAIVGKGILSRKYTVEIGDHAGERIEEFDSSSEEWLHRTEYFKYVVGCQVIFLAVDAAKLVDGDSAVVARMENELVAAFQVLINDKGVAAGQQLRAPVALLILKADLIKAEVPEPKQEQEFYRAKLDRLVSLCERRCRHFRLFEVSATGDLGSDGEPPPKLVPQGVVDPMIWALVHATGDTSPNPTLARGPSQARRA